MYKRIFIILLSLLTGILYSQNSRVSGKIVGTVIDNETSEPIVGVNVYLDGTSYGASTDEDGYYIILNIPAGTYDVVFSFVGYGQQKFEEVTVRPDFKSTLNIKLKSEIMEGEEIVVTAEKPMIQKDITATVREITATEIRHSPVSNFTQVMAQQLGAIETGRGRRSGGIHIRGGRSNEVVYYVDGVNTNDPFVGAIGVSVDNNSIEQLNIISGGFNAEYGESMSGVVQIITKSGRPDKYSLNLEVTSDAPFSNTQYDWGYNKYYADVQGPVPFLANQNGAFYGTFTYLTQDDRLPSITFQDHNDRKRISSSLKLTMEPIRSVLRLQAAARFTETDDNLYSHARAAYPFWQNQGLKRDTGDRSFSLTVSHTLSNSTWYDITVSSFENYNEYAAQNKKSYKDWRIVDRYMDWVGYAEDQGWYDRHTGQFSGMSEDEAFYYYYENVANNGKGFVSKGNDGNWNWNSPDAKQTAMNNRYYDTGQYVITESGDVVYREFDADNYLKYLSDPDNPAYADYEYNGDIDDFYPSSNDILGNFDLDFAPRWHSRDNSYLQGEIIVASQIDKNNFLKTGGWLRRYDLQYTDMQFYNTKPYFDLYEKNPLEAAIYMQDKFEFEDLVINGGLRYDYWDPDSENPIDLADLDKGKTKTKPKAQISPRLGISFAASSEMTMYVHYGRFFQKPDLSDLFLNLNADITNGLPLLGNPNIPPEKTTAYEIGFQQQLNPDVSLKISAYYKDVQNLLSSDQVNTIYDGSIANYTIYLINDFAKVKGFEIELKKRMLPGLSGSLTYGYIDAKGTGSDGRDFYYDYLLQDSELPRKEYPLDFDITHDFKAKLNYYIPRNSGPQIMGFKPLSDVNVNIYGAFNTGAAYTPTNSKGDPLEKGSGRMPSYFNMDVRVDKYIPLGIDDMELNLFVDIRNIFDIRNVLDVYTRTGEPDDNGLRPIWDPANLGDYSDYAQWGYGSAYDMYLADVDGWKLRQRDPANYSNPRIIRTGLMIKF